MDQLAFCEVVGALIASDEKNGLQKNGLVCIMTSTNDSSTGRMLLCLKNQYGPLDDQFKRLIELHNCIKDPNSPDYIILIPNGRVTKISKDIIRIVEPEEFETIVFTYLLKIDSNNLNFLAEFLSFFVCASAPYFDSIFKAVCGAVTETITNFQTTSFVQYEKKRNIIGHIFLAFYSLLQKRHVRAQAGEPEFNTQTFFESHMTKAPSAAQKQLIPISAFSEVALTVFHQLLQKIKEEQHANPFFYFDRDILMRYTLLFRKVEGLFTTLLDVGAENLYRKAAVETATKAIEQFHNDKPLGVNEPILLPNGDTASKILVITFAEFVINAYSNYFDSCVDAFCFFLCLEPSLMLAFEDEQIHEQVFPALNEALREKGSRKNASFDTLLANHNVRTDLNGYYVNKVASSKCFFYKEKMFCTLTYRNFDHITDSPELTKLVVLDAPTEFDRELYSEVKPGMRVTVRQKLIESEANPEEQLFVSINDIGYENVKPASLPRSFLKAWETNNTILKEHLRALMENGEKYLATLVTGLIHDSEPHAETFLNIILETNKPQPRKIFENIWHTGICWHLLIVCLEKCEGVQTLFPQYAEKIHKKLGEATTSIMSFGTLKYYYHRLKDQFNETQQKFIEKKMEERWKAEDCFRRYVDALTDYTIDEMFRKCAKTHGYVFFACFFYRFLDLALDDYDIHKLEKELIIFRDTAFQIPTLRRIFADMNFKKQMGILLSSTMKQLPQEQIDHIFNYTWAKLHTTDMIGRTMLEQFEKSSLRLIKRLGLGAQAEASLVRVPNYPFEVVAKIAMDLESFYEISGEIDSLMRTQSHPHVLHIYGYVVEFGDHVGIVMEYCKGGTVQNVLDDPNEVVDERRSLHWATQAASGLLFLDKYLIIHRDVKPDNMLLDVTKSHLKISDLGISKILTDKKSPEFFKLQTTARSDEDKTRAVLFGRPESTAKFGMTSGRGTEGYRAPEIFTSVYSSAVDVFSLGRSLWAMIYRSNPSETLVAITWGAPSISKADAPLPVFTPSDSLRSIAGRMMNGNQEFRSTIQEAYNNLCQLYEDDGCPQTSSFQRKNK